MRYPAPSCASVSEPRVSHPCRCSYLTACPAPCLCPIPPPAAIERRGNQATPPWPPWLPFSGALCCIQRCAARMNDAWPVPPFIHRLAAWLSARTRCQRSHATCGLCPLAFFRVRTATPGFTGNPARRAQRSAFCSRSHGADGVPKMSTSEWVRKYATHLRCCRK